MGWLCPWDLPTAGPLHAAVLTLVLTSLLTQSAAFGLRDSGGTPCDYNNCWRLYESAMNYYQTTVEIYEKPNQDLDPAVHRKICIIIRTFHLCMKGKSRECRSDLGFHGAQRGIENQMKDYKCNETGETFKEQARPNSPSPPVYVGECSYPRLASGAPPEYSHCGLFGDPHLRTFSGEFQTCRVQGAWPLINNKHLTVQVTNEFVDVEDSATATTKLTVVIKGHTTDECADGDRFVTYQAQKDHLPATFDDGRVEFGTRGAVRITERTPGLHVEIYLSYIDTTLVIRKIGQFLTFAIQIPTEVTRESIISNGDPDEFQLCKQGCPKSERIDYKEYLVSRRSHSSSKGSSSSDGSPGVTLPQVAMSRDIAELRCREVGVKDFYFDSCVFDLISTGDLNFTSAALYAYDDTIRLYPPFLGELKNRTSLDEIDKEYVDRNHAASAKTSKLSYIHRTTYILMHVLAYLMLSNLVRGNL